MAPDVLKIAPQLFDFNLIHGTKTLFNWIYFQPVTEYSLGGLSDQGCLTKSLQFAWVEVVKEVEEAPLHLSHVWDICEKGVLQGGRLDHFTGPCWLGGPGLLFVGPE